jgi:hypothetical protein
MALSLSGDGEIAGFDPVASGFGKVLQVVSVTKINTFSSTSTSFVDVTDLALTITPADSSNKILVVAMLSLRNALSGYNTGSRVIRGASTVITSQAGDYGDVVTQSNSRLGAQIFMHLDSPATTSATTYKVQIRNEGGSTSNALVNDFDGRNATSSFTLIEVAA